MNSEQLVKIVFFGTSEFAVPILERLAGSPWRPTLVVTTPDAPAGRGRELRPPPIKTAAKRLGIPVIQPETLSAVRCPLSADIFIVAAYGKILPKELLDVPKCGSLNVHPSLLPRWRGASPVQHTILAGDRETGVTIILIDEKVDHGPIIKNSKFKIQNSKVTTPELTWQLAELGATLLLETIPEWLAGTIAPQLQDETRATYARRLTREDGRIDWSKSAEEIELMVRAFQPWPGAYSFWRRDEREVRLMVEEADSGQRIADSSGVGTVFRSNGELAVKAGTGVLLPKRLKPEGGRSMSGRDFLRGHHDIIGSTLQ